MKCQQIGSGPITYTSGTSGSSSVKNDSRYNETVNMFKPAGIDDALSHFIYFKGDDKLFLILSTNLMSPPGEKLKIEKLSNDLSYSTKQYTRLFKKAYDIPPSEYILNKRLKYAQFLLLNSNDYIHNIVRACGFTDPLYFSRIFHKKFGVSPSEFRNRK